MTQTESLQTSPITVKPETIEPPVLGAEHCQILQELRETYKLDHSDNSELFQQLSIGNTQARDKIVENYLPMANALARKYAGRTEPEEDLRQVAYVGLLNAVDRYDTGKDISFSSFAYPTINGEIRRHFRDYSWRVHVPRGMQEMGLAIRKIMDKAHKETGKECTIRQAAEQLGVGYEEAENAVQAYLDGFAPLSLDSSLDAQGDTDSETLQDTVPSTESVTDQAFYDLEIRRILKYALDPREKEIFWRSVILDQSQSEISQAIGISQMHVSRLLRRLVQRANETGSVDIAEAA